MCTEWSISCRQFFSYTHIWTFVGTVKAKKFLYYYIFIIYIEIRISKVAIKNYIPFKTIYWLVLHQHWILVDFSNFSELFTFYIHTYIFRSISILQNKTFLYAPSSAYWVFGLITQLVSWREPNMKNFKWISFLKMYYRCQ